MSSRCKPTAMQQPGISLLDTLFRVASLAEFASHTASTQFDMFFKCLVGDIRGRSPPAGREEDMQLLEVVCHALDLVEQHLESAAEAASAAPRLHELLPAGAACAVANMLRTWILKVEHVASSKQGKELAVVATAAGLPRRLAGACFALSKAISSSSSSSQSLVAAGATPVLPSSSSLEQSGLPELFFQLMDVFLVLASVHKGDGAAGSSSSSSGAAPPPPAVVALPAVAELALAVLRSQELLSCRTTLTPAAQQAGQAGLAWMTLSLIEDIAIVFQLLLLSVPELDSSPNAAALEELVRSDSWEQMTLLYLGLTVGYLHQQQRQAVPQVRTGAAAAARDAGSSRGGSRGRGGRRGSSSSRGGSRRARRQDQQQQYWEEVPAFHQHLLQAMGAADRLLQLLSADSPDAAVVWQLVCGAATESGTPSNLRALFLVLWTAAMRQHAVVATSSTTSSSSTAALEPTTAAATAKLSAVGVLAEAALPLVRDDCSAAQLALQCVWPCLMEVLGNGTIGQQHAVQEQLRPMLHQILQAVLVAVVQCSEAASAANLEPHKTSVRVTSVATVLLVSSGHITGDSTSVVADMMQRHTKQYCKLLEAQVRAHSSFSTLHNKIADLCVHAFKEHQGELFCSALAADEAAAQQLFALLLTCLKASKQPLLQTEHDRLSRQLHRVATYLQCADQCAAAAAAHGSSSSSRLWCVLAGRCLLALAKALQWAPAQEPPTADSGLLVGSIQQQQAVLGGSPPPLQLEPLSHFVGWLTEAVLPDDLVWLTVSGPAAAASPAACLQLLEAARQLLQQLDRASCKAAAAAAGQQQPDWQAWAAAMDAEPLAQQLEVFGAALCAQLPGRFCCNYHGCTNIATASELQLVAGAGTVCCGCKTARYCSAACQKAHWKDWHKPVCQGIKKLQQQ